MQDSLERRDSGNPSMEAVIGCEVPACQPDQDIVPDSEEPQYWQVGVSQIASTIREISPELRGGIGIVEIVAKDVI